MNNRRSTLVFCVLLFAMAMLVRCLGIGWGLPTREHWYSYHPDEHQIAQAMFQLDFLGGQFNPHFFNYPSLFIYLAYMVHGAMALAGLTHLPGNDPVQMALYISDMMLAGRLVSATLGAATVPLVFLIARRFAGDRGALLAALLMMLAPGHVQHSHFATSDVPATFFVTLAVWLSLRALGTEAAPAWRGKQLMLAAFVTGLAAATKYNAVLVLCVPILTWFYVKREGGSGRASIVALVGLSVVGFLLGCPYSVLDFSNFWGNGTNSGFAYELLVHPKQGHGDVFIDTGIGWVYHAVVNIPFLLTLPIALAALVGTIRTRIVRRRETCLLFTWAFLYFVAIGFSHVRFMRYLLPIAPALCIFAACAVMAWRIKPVKAASGIALLVFALWGTRDVTYQFTHSDPRDEGAAYMAQNATAPATVGMPNAPWYWSPPLSPQDVPPPFSVTTDQLYTFSGERYHFVITGLDAAKLRQEKPQWYLLSEFEWREKARLKVPEYLQFHEALEKDYELVVRCQNIAPGALPGRDFVPHDFVYTNPEIEVYKRR